VDTGSSGLYRLDKQLRAAEQTGKKVYLIVTDTLPDHLFADVNEFAKARGVIEVLKISERDIKTTATTLKST